MRAEGGPQASLGNGGVGEAFLKGETLEPCLEVQLEVHRETRQENDMLGQSWTEIRCVQSKGVRWEGV